MGVFTGVVTFFSSRASSQGAGWRDEYKHKRDSGEMFRVVSFGSLIQDSRFYFKRNGRVTTMYPDGYTIQRRVFSKGRGTRAKITLPGDDAKNDLGEVYYTATIKRRDDGGPCFQVVRSDKPDVIHSGDQCSPAWRKALEAAKQDFPDAHKELAYVGSDDKGCMIVQGAILFGLTAKPVVDELNKMAKALSINEWLSTISADTKSLGDPIGSPIPSSSSQPRKPKQQLVTSSQPSQSSSWKTRGKKNVEAPEDDDVPYCVRLSNSEVSASVPCSICGSTTPFCPITGKRHDTTGKGGRGRKKSELTEGAVAPSEPTGKKRGRRKKQPRDDDGAEGSQNMSASSGDAVKRRRTSDGATEKGPSTRDAKRQMLLFENNGNAVDGSLANGEAPYAPPPVLFRPPLSPPQSKEALRVLQRTLQALSVVRTPFTSLLQLREPGVKKTTHASSKSDKGAGSQANIISVNGADADGNDAAAARKQAEEGTQHFLDIVDMDKGTRARRYIKFMKLYTSERTKMDLLKKAANSNPDSS